MKQIVTTGMIVILALASVLAVGCTQTSNTDSQGIVHDSRLEQYLNVLHQTIQEGHPQNLTAWRITWLNSTAAKVTWSYTFPQEDNASLNATYQETFTITRFFSVKAASAYVLQINSGYKVVSVTYGAGGAYERFKGNPPATFISYQDRAAQGKFIWQLDEFVQQGELTRTFE
jgi:hypothetical protein